MAKTVNPFMFVNTRGDAYYLHSVIVTLKRSKFKQKIYFFSREIKPGYETPVILPAGYEVEESLKTGMPYLKKGGVSF